MTYEYFLDRLEQLIQEHKDADETVKRVRILKNNGVKLDGFSYYVAGHREHPTVYVNRYYREGLTEEELLDIAELVLKTQRESQLFSIQGLELMLDFRKMKERVLCRLINRERNEELLKEVPWLPWLDLAVVFYFLVPEQMVKHATALIYTKHMEYWGVEMEDICRAAAENMARTQVFLEPMEEFLGEMGVEPLSSGLHILSNGQKEYGAAVILDPKVQRMCFEKLGESYYVIPSSVHELLLLPLSLSTGRSDLDELIQEVNASCVSEEEYLSGHAYFYSEETEMVDC